MTGAAVAIAAGRSPRDEVATAPGGAPTPLSLPMPPPIRIEDPAILYLVAAGFLLSLVSIGYVFRRFSANARDYFCANGQAKWWLVGGSVFMQSFSAWTFTGAAGAAYSAGWSLVVMYGAGVVASTVTALTVAPWFRRLRVTTPADAIRLRYGPGMEQLYSYLQLVAGLLFSSMQLLSLAIFTSALLGFPVWAVTLALGTVVLFYTVLSGAWAVLAADFVQSMVLVPVTVLLTWECLHRMGGFDGLLAHISAAGLSAQYAPFKSLKTIAAIPGIEAGYFSLGFFFAWHLNTTIQTNSLMNCGKYLTVKDDREARKAAALTAALSFVAMLVFFVPPITARLLIPGDIAALGLSRPAEGAYAAIAMHLLPTGLVALVLVAMCAATMSSLDGGLTGLAAIVTENAYPAICRRLRRRPREGAARLRLGRVVNLACAGTVISLTLLLARAESSRGVFGLGLDIIAIVLAPVALPMALGLWVRRVPAGTPAFTIGCGLAVAVAVAFLPQRLGAAPWLYHERILTVIAAGTVAFFASRAWNRGLDEETARRDAAFFALRDRPVDFAVEIGVGNDARQMRILGSFAGVLALAFLLLLFPRSSRGFAPEFIVLAGTSVLIGATLHVMARRLERNR